MIPPVRFALRLPGFSAVAICWLFYFPVSALPAAEKSEAPPLLEAVRSGDASARQALLAQHSDVNVRDFAGNSALHLAALRHDVAALNALLAAGAEADVKNNAGATPLLYGAGHAEIVRTLLARGANPNAVSAAKNTPLVAATAHPLSYEVVRLLIEAGADVHVKKTTDNEVVLTRAIFAGDRRTIDLLLDRGAATDPKSAATALNLSAFKGDADTVKLLLAKKADPNLNPDFVGHALNSALMAEQLGVAQLLIENGADLNLRSPDGHGTPPMVFAAYNQSGDPSIAKTLVARGVDVSVANDQGATALGWALRSGPHTPLAEYLRSVGAKSSEPVRGKRIPDRSVPASPQARAALVRERMPATLKLLQRSSDTFLENGFVRKSNCTSCHGQDLPGAVYGMARERGFVIDDVSLGRQLAAQLSRWRERAEVARQMSSPLPGSPVTIAYGLFGLRGARYPADDTTDAMTRYLIRTQQPSGEWIDPIRRPPIEDGTFMATGWITFALRDYPPRGLEREAAESLARARQWIAKQDPATHNEVVFQLLGLHWGGASKAEKEAFVARLVRQQRPDGGWAQLPGLESDAWATGTALYALHEAAAMRATDENYQRGLAFLLRTQFEDGSWWVRTRTWPFQPHFNGQFPHGKDQWISQGASAWAAMALLFTLDPVKPVAPWPTAQEVIAAYANSSAAERTAKTAEVSAPAKVDFVRDIQPILERSCTGCHGGEKPKGDFALASRDSLLKGGQSGEPAIVPGYADDSPLIQYVGGKIEDLEMPPLDRRGKYPALKPEEIELLRAWIDAGAPWAPIKTVQTN